MTTLPARNVLDGSKTPATTTSEMKTALGSVRDFLSESLGPDGITAHRLLAIRVFTVSGTYTPTTGTRAVVVEVQGGGGGGGSAAQTAAGQISGAAGGGAGGYALKRIVNPGTQAVTVGAAGAGGSAAGAGTAGGTLSFGSFVSATGGAGGTSGGSGAFGSGVGVPGGSTVGGDINIFGQDGSGPWGIGSVPIVRSGEGGNSRFGAGGSLVASFATGNQANGNGAGGGGGACTPSSAGAASGGAGSAGVVVIWEYA